MEVDPNLGEAGDRLRHLDAKSQGDVASGTHSEMSQGDDEQATAMQPTEAPDGGIEVAPITGQDEEPYDKYCAELHSRYHDRILELEQGMVYAYLAEDGTLEDPMDGDVASEKKESPPKDDAVQSAPRTTTQETGPLSGFEDIRSSIQKVVALTAQGNDHVSQQDACGLMYYMLLSLNHTFLHARHFPFMEETKFVQSEEDTTHPYIKACLLPVTCFGFPMAKDLEGTADAPLLPKDAKSYIIKLVACNPWHPVVERAMVLKEFAVGAVAVAPMSSRECLIAYATVEDAQEALEKINNDVDVQTALGVRKPLPSELKVIPVKTPPSVTSSASHPTPDGASATDGDTPAAPKLSSVAGSNDASPSENKGAREEGGDAETSSTAAEGSASGEKTSSDAAAARSPHRTEGETQGDNSVKSNPADAADMEVDSNAVGPSSADTADPIAHTVVDARVQAAEVTGNSVTESSAGAAADESAKASADADVEASADADVEASADADVEASAKADVEAGSVDFDPAEAAEAPTTARARARFARWFGWSPLLPREWIRQVSDLHETFEQLARASQQHSLLSPVDNWKPPERIVPSIDASKLRGRDLDDFVFKVQRWLYLNWASLADLPKAYPSPTLFLCLILSLLA